MKTPVRKLIREVIKPIPYYKLVEYMGHQGWGPFSFTSAFSELTSNSGFMVDPKEGGECYLAWKRFDEILSKKGRFSLKDFKNDSVLSTLNWNNISAEFPKWERARGLRDANFSHYLLDGICYPYDEKWDYIKSPQCKQKYVTSKNQLNGKELILIPCNSGALNGDYFLQQTWRNAAKWFPERMTTLDFAAVDSITTAIPDDGKGLIVFENEMDRVKGYDMFPTYSDEKKRLCKLKFEQSVPRLLNYEHIFVYLNVRLYDETIRECALPNMTFIDVGYKQGYFNQKLPVLRDIYDNSVA
jgi:hypothetical protein